MTISYGFSRFIFTFYYTFLFKEFNLHRKIHVNIDHYSDYFQWTNLTMRLTNTEFTETAHTTFKLKLSEIIKKFEHLRKIGMPVRQEMTQKSFVWHNSKRAGVVSPSEFLLRKRSQECGAHHYHFLMKHRQTGKQTNKQKDRN